MLMNSEYYKYIKYKTKYLNLLKEINMRNKQQSSKINLTGGTLNYDCNTKMTFINQLGTCWNIAPLLILLLSDNFVKQGNKFINFTPEQLNEFIDLTMQNNGDYISKLLNYSPGILLQTDSTTIDPVKLELVPSFIRSLHTMLQEYFKIIENNELPDEIDYDHCKLLETNLTNDYLKLYMGKHDDVIRKEMSGMESSDKMETILGNNQTIANALLCDLIGTIVHNTKIILTVYIKLHSLHTTYIKPFNKFIFDRTEGLLLILRVLKGGIEVSGHVGCIYICNGEYKFTLGYSPGLMFHDYNTFINYMYEYDYEIRILNTDRFTRALIDKTGLRFDLPFFFNQYHIIVIDRISKKYKHIHIGIEDDEGILTIIEENRKILDELRTNTDITTFKLINFCGLRTYDNHKIVYKNINYSDPINWNTSVVNTEDDSTSYLY